MSFLKNKKSKTGFTLIELLVVIAIISLLSSVVMASLNTARMKARDARRLNDLWQIQTALELYFNANGRYPPRNYAITGTEACGGNASWCSLKTDLVPYIPSIPGDPLGSQTTNRYYYDADSGDNYQTYGMMMRLESSGNFSKAATDGGYAGYANTGTGQYYEVGQQPIYCQNKYTSTSRNWWGSASTVCVGGN